MATERLGTGGWHYRTQPRAGDGEAIRAIVRSSGYFNDEEVAIAVELLDERLARGDASGYHFLFADAPGGESAGYTCFGRIPGTASSFDLYWIAVHESRRGSGLGRALLERSESIISQMGGSRVYIETSGREQYLPTRGFYLRCGYEEAAKLPDFYGPGDAKVIYARALG